MSLDEEKLSKIARYWKVLNPPLSWGMGIGIFLYVTITHAGEQSPAWYVIVGGLLGFPLISMWGQNNRKNGDKDDK